MGTIQVFSEIIRPEKPFWMYSSALLAENVYCFPDNVVNFYQVLQLSDNIFVLCELCTRWLHLQTACESDSDTELAFEFACVTL